MSKQTDCPASEDGHRYEASTTVYLDLDWFSVTDEGKVIVEDMSPSRLNDEYKGVPMDLESNFKVSCAECGKEFDWDLSDLARARVALQPIGDAPRRLGKRGGLA